MPVTLAEVLQLTYELVTRAERAEKLLEVAHKQIAELQREIQVFIDASVPGNSPLK